MMSASLAVTLKFIQRGLIWNPRGLLRYDGVRWRTLLVPLPEYPAHNIRLCGLEQIGCALPVRFRTLWVPQNLNNVALPGHYPSPIAIKMLFDIIVHCLFIYII